MMDEKEIKRLFADKNACRRQVRLAAVQVEGLGDEELSTALAYEVEPYSSVPAAEARVAWREIPGEDAAIRVFEVAVIRRRRSDDVNSRLERTVRILTVPAAVVLLAVAVDFVLAEKETGRLEESLARRAGLQAQLDRLDRETEAARRETREIVARREAEARAQAECARLRGAYPGFLAAAASVGGSSFIRSIAADGPFCEELAIVSVDERSAAETMAALTGHLAAEGWVFVPGAMTPAGGGTVEFKGKAVFPR